MRPSIGIWALLIAANVAWPMAASAQSASPANPSLAPSATSLPYSWEGFYIRGSADLASSASRPTAYTISDTWPNLASAANTNDGISSGEIGANWQTGNTVVGFQSDMQWSDEWMGAVGACGLGCSLSNKVKVPWLATLRARAGESFDRLFVYGTGGLATLGAADNLNAGGVGITPDFADFSVGNVGWTIGGGVEMALDKNVSAKLEYLYMPTDAPTGAFSVVQGAGNDSLKNNIVRGGINYQLPIDAW
jgi:outer membrane immunogenic protein